MADSNEHEQLSLGFFDISKEMDGEVTCGACGKHEQGFRIAYKLGETDGQLTKGQIIGLCCLACNGIMRIPRDGFLRLLPNPNAESTKELN